MNKEPISLINPILDTTTPWWGKFLVQIIFWFGPSIVVAAVFMSMWTGWLPSPITQNREILIRVENKLDASIMTMTNKVASLDFRDESMLRILLVICRNSANSVIQRIQCDDYWKRN